MKKYLPEIAARQKRIRLVMWSQSALTLGILILGGVLGAYQLFFAIIPLVVIGGWLGTKNSKCLKCNKQIGELVSINSNVTISFCPHCGVKIVTDEEE